MSDPALQPMAALIAGHDVIVAVAGRAGSALGAGDLRAAARHAVEILELLGPQTAVEEEGLFPALAVEFPDEVAWLVGQHRRIGSGLAEAARVAGSGSAAPGWDVRLADALHLLHEHILAEQEGAFPAALAILGPDQWAAVDAVRVRLSVSAVPVGDGASGAVGTAGVTGAHHAMGDVGTSGVDPAARGTADGADGRVLAD
jgi:hypothetical protein